MTEAAGGSEAFRQALDAARLALSRGDRAEARRMARLAAKLNPRSETPWLFLAAASAPRAGLAYAARALEINPRSQAARKAVRWLVHRLPPRQQRPALRQIRLPDDLRLELAPPESVTTHRLAPAWVPVSLLALAIAAGLWWSSPPAGAEQPERVAFLAAKSSFTPTATSTSTPTPTLTPTPTATYTPTATITPTPTPRPSFSWEYSLDPKELAGEGRWIDVDLSEQTVTAYEGESAVRTFIVSTGTRAHPTVTGQFHVYVKLLSTPMAGPGYYLPGVPYTMYFYRGYALHGTYWHSNFGHPMSHGCINLKTPEAEWLFGFASVGTLVNIHP